MSRKPEPSEFLAIPVVGTDLIAFYRGSDVSRPLFISYLELLKILTAAISGGSSGLLLKTNGTENPVQDVLNLVNGTNVTITDDGSGNITISTSGGSGIATRVAFWNPTDVLSSDPNMYWDNVRKSLVLGTEFSPSASAKLYLFSNDDNPDILIESVYNQRVKFKNNGSGITWYLLY